MRWTTPLAWALALAGCGAPLDVPPEGGMDGGMDASRIDAAACERDARCLPPLGPPPVAGCNPELGVECDGDWTGSDPRTGELYCDPACAAAECCAPRDGRFQCVARGADGACPAADVFVDARVIDGLYTIEEQTFAESDCAIAEGCVGGSRGRRLLRFEVATPNHGDADVFLGAAPELGVSTPLFEWSACHAHHHFPGYADYELLTADGCCAVVRGRKQSFCLTDLLRDRPDMGAEEPAYDCGYQGIQRGWRDVYAAGLDCQWLDITGVPSGEYVLRVRLNTDHALLESDYQNNEALVPVTIP
ncbi:MAG: hypothetical protein SangKO_004200 [Sandaracinaceae bacterium]